MKKDQYITAEYISISDNELLETVPAEACGSVAGSCYGTSSCGCHYGK